MIGSGAWAADVNGRVSAVHVHRNRVLVWSGAVHVWDDDAQTGDDEGMGRREVGPASGQWQVGDVISLQAVVA